MKERWKVIPGFSRYQISTHGRIKSACYAKERVIKTHFNRGHPKYAGASLWPDEGKRKFCLVHRLMLTAFVGPCESPRIYGAHLNGYSDDNRLENLAWVTPKENSAHMIAHDTSNRGRSVKLRTGDVLKIRRLYAAKMFNAPELAEKYGISRRHIYAIVYRQRWAHI